MIRRLRVFLCVSCIFISCSDRGAQPPEPPVEPINIIDGWPSWSPDGRYIYYDHDARNLDELERYGQLSIWAYDTQTGHIGFLVGPGMFAKSNRQETILAFDWGWNLFFYYFDSRTVRQVTHGIEAIEFNWSPSGKSLIISPGDGILIDTLGNIYAHLIPWDRSNAGWLGGWDGDWFSENRILIMSDDSLSRTGLLIIDTLGQVIDTVTIEENPRFDFRYPSISPDQSRIVVVYIYIADDSSTESDLRMFDRDGVLVTTIDGANGRWSPDGSKIVYQHYTWMGENPFPFDPDYSRITPWLCNADGSDPHELLGWPQPPPDTTMFGGGYNWLTDTYGP